MASRYLALPMRCFSMPCLAGLCHAMPLRNETFRSYAFAAQSASVRGIATPMHIESKLCHADAWQNRARPLQGFALLLRIMAVGGISAAVLGVATPRWAMPQQDYAQLCRRIALASVSMPMQRIARLSSALQCRCGVITKLNSAYARDGRAFAINALRCRCRAVSYSGTLMQGVRVRILQIRPA